MPSATAESVHHEAERAELSAVLQSQLFTRSPALAHLLSYLCEKHFSGEGANVKEYSVALDVFGRQQSFDQDTDSIVRVQANRLRKRLAEYYSGEGAAHNIRLTIPVGQYVPVFEAHAEQTDTSDPTAGPPKLQAESRPESVRFRKAWLLYAAVATLIMGAAVWYVERQRAALRFSPPVPESPATAEPIVGLPVGDEIRILAGSNRSYVDRSGKQWSADNHFTGGVPVRSPVQYIWRTQDPAIYRSSRQGDFTYNIPLKPGIYELRLHFAETFYGPEDVGGGGEGSRIMTITANEKALLPDFDVLADSGGGRTAEVRTFTDIAPAADGLLHLSFSSVKGGRGMVSGIEILPGIPGHIRPVRIVARNVPYYSNDSHWWSSDVYFKGGQLAGSEEPASGTDDPELYETERWGNFSYAIPAAPGKYRIILHFIERSLHTADQGPSVPTKRVIEAQESRVFDVFCNGKTIVHNLNILSEAGANRPLVRSISGLVPNAQGKLLLEFVPVSHYATVTAIELVPE